MTAPPALTERQAQVAEGLGRHLKHKEIARELGISTSAVAKHVSALKQAYGAQSHGEIVAAHRAAGHRQPGVSGVEKAPCPIFHLPSETVRTPQAAASDHGFLGLSDGADYPFTGSTAIDWPGVVEPQIVPRWLDGQSATATRLMVVLGGILAFVAALVLTISAIDGLSELVGGSDPDLALQNRIAR